MNEDQRAGEELAVQMVDQPGWLESVFSVPWMLSVPYFLVGWCGAIIFIVWVDSFLKSVESTDYEI